MLLARDHERFSETWSPLLPVVQDFPDDVELREWFNGTYAEFVRPLSASLIGATQFVALLGERIAGDPGHRAELFRGLEQSEIEGFLARATVVQAAAGDKISYPPTPSAVLPRFAIGEFGIDEPYRLGASRTV